MPRKKNPSANLSLRKGQKIPKAIFLAFNSSKKRTKQSF